MTPEDDEEVVYDVLFKYTKLKGIVVDFPGTTLQVVRAVINYADQIELALEALEDERENMP